MPETTFMIWSRDAGKISVEPTNISAEGGPIYPRLVIPIGMDFSPLSEYDTKKTLNYEMLEIQCALDIGSRISDAVPIITRLKITRPNFYTTYRLEFPLDHYRILKIEEMRVKDLGLRLNLKFLVAVYQSFEPPDTKQKIEFVSGYDAQSLSIATSIPYSHWIEKILPALGYGQVELIEVSTSNTVFGEGFVDSVKEFKSAKTYFNVGDYDKAVAHCRSSIEPLKKRFPELKSLIGSDTEHAWITEIGTATVEWLEKVYQKTHSLTSKPHHLPSIGHFSRHDAQAIMLVTTALISYASRLTETNEKEK